MKSWILKTPTPRGRVAHLICRAVISAAVLLGAAAAQAQTIYRIVGSDGRITFSDKPPSSAESATVLVPGGKSVPVGAALLPPELRQAAGKYPVTLYTAGNCAPCNSGRELLSGRGIPFSEKTINTADDSEALQRISGGISLPFLTIGSQQIKGYSESEWTQFLDAAGYPKTSVLPTGYRAPPATPLVVLQTAAPAVKPEEAQPARTPAEPGQVPNNPAGIRF
ncbi:MAG: glutaredoxin family protein [Rhodoferax sp.]